MAPQVHFIVFIIWKFVTNFPLCFITYHVFLLFNFTHVIVVQLYRLTYMDIVYIECDEDITMKCRVTVR